MSRKSATDTIKALSSGNISGVIPQSLDLIKTLKKVKGNPKLQLAIGAGNLLGMQMHILQLFGSPNLPLNIVQSALGSLNIPQLSQLTGLANADVSQIAKEFLGASPFNMVLNTSITNLFHISDSILGLNEVDSIARNQINNAIEELTRIHNTR